MSNTVDASTRALVAAEIMTRLLTDDLCADLMRNAPSSGGLSNIVWTCPPYCETQKRLAETLAVNTAMQICDRIERMMEPRESGVAAIGQSTPERSEA